MTIVYINLMHKYAIFFTILYLASCGEIAENVTDKKNSEPKQSLTPVEISPAQPELEWEIQPIVKKSQPQPPQKEIQPEIVPIPIQAKSVEKSNDSSDKSTWGSPITVVDTSGNTLFKDDHRINNLHKQKYPSLGTTHVMWRMNHDGSCWVSANTTLLFYQLIEGGPAKFDDAIAKMKLMAQKRIEEKADSSLSQFFEQFFNIFALVRANFTHRYAIDLRNHATIYSILTKGMRMLLTTTLNSDYYETHPNSWASAVTFINFFNQLGLPHIALDIYDENGDGNDSYFRIGGDATALPDPAPTIMVMLSTPGFVDVLVSKEFSDTLKRR